MVSLTWWNLADGGRVPAISLVAIRTLHKDTRVAETFGKHFPAYVVQSNALSDVSPRLLHHLISVDVREKPQAEPFRIRGIREPVHSYRRLRRVKSLSDTCIQLVVADRAPESRFMVHHRLRDPLWTRGESGGT